MISQVTTPVENVAAVSPPVRRDALGGTFTSIGALVAEWEVVSLIARGRSREESALGIHRAVVQRVLGLLHGVGDGTGPVLLAGGGARNHCVVRLMSEAAGVEVIVSARPQLTAAVGLSPSAKPARGRSGRQHSGETAALFGALPCTVLERAGARAPIGARVDLRARGAGKARGYEGPVDHLPEVSQVLGTPVLIPQVVGMLPHIHAQQG